VNEVNRDFCENLVMEQIMFTPLVLTGVPSALAHSRVPSRVI